MERIGGLNAVADFSTDPSNNDLIGVRYVRGDTPGLYRLALQPVEGDPFPQTLAETGLFADLENLIPNPGLVSYDINVPFWSDHALKSRYFSIPNTTDEFGYTDNGTWTLPTGAIWVKHFDMLADMSDPESSFKLETRLIVKNDEGVYGVTYRWNEEQTEATLVSANGEDTTFTVMEGGQEVLRHWRFPSFSECLICHTNEAGGALSFNTRQMNLEGRMHGEDGNFLTLMQSMGYLDDLPAPASELPKHVHPTEDEYSLEARVRSYLAVNCAYCHDGSMDSSSDWDARPNLTMTATGIINGMMERALDPDDRLIIPNDINHSAILSRISATNGYGRMPPVGSNILDQEAIDLLTAFINEEASEILTYEDWRSAHFGLLTDPKDAPGDDPDGDLRTNREEYLANTNPIDPNDTWGASIQTSEGMVNIAYEGLGNRTTIIEKSTDLINWEFWDVAGNNGQPRNPDRTHIFTDFADDEKAFFRVRIEER